jgi:hypothetical protein
MPREITKHNLLCIQVIVYNGYYSFDLILESDRQGDIFVFTYRLNFENTVNLDVSISRVSIGIFLFRWMIRVYEG